MTAQQLKNAILQEAIEGRLVPQDPNDEPASILLERIRKEKERLFSQGVLKKKELLGREIVESDTPFSLPKGWVWTKIDNVAFVTKLAGFEYSEYIADNLVSKDSGIPLFKGKNVQNGKIIYEFEAYIPLSLSNELKRSQINKKCLLTPYVGTIGNIGIHDKEGIFHLGSNVGKIEFYNDSDTNILEEYVKYYLLSSYGYDELTKYKKATAQESISIEAIRDVFLPLPPLAEQKRIVAKIEELLPKVEKYGKSQDELNKLNEELPERLKKSILQEAIEGRLVPQDPNDEPASVLLQKIREEKQQLVKAGKLKKKDLIEAQISEDEIPFEIPDTWEWCRLGTIVTLIGGFAFKSHEYTSTGSRVIRISDITENGFINKNVVRYPFNDKLSQYRIFEGDILMAMTGGTVGKSLYVKDLPEEIMLLNQRVAIIRVNTVFTDYIDYVIKSQHIQSIITEAKNSTNDNISMGDIFNFPIPLPPLSEQKRIVAKIEEVFAEIDKLK